jgi:hypothetical protein
MIVNDFDVGGALIRPHKAHTPLVVDTNRVLSGAVAFQQFEPVAGRGSKIAQPAGHFQLLQLAPRHGLDRGHAWHVPTLEQSLRIGALEGSDGHAKTVIGIVNNVKRYYPILGGVVCHDG